MALPDGALEQLLTNGTEAFDAAIAADRVATQAAMKPVVAQNAFNLAKGAKSDAATRDALKTQEPAKDEKGVVVADEKPLIIEGGMFDHLADAPIEDVRQFVGTSRPALPEQYVENWDEGLEREYLTFVANNQISSQTAQRLLDWYAEMSIVSSDKPRDWAIARFNETFADLPKPVRDKLVEFYLIDLLGDGEEQQA